MLCVCLKNAWNASYAYLFAFNFINKEKGEHLLIVISKPAKILISQENVLYIINISPTTDSLFSPPPPTHTLLISMGLSFPTHNLTIGILTYFQYRSYLPGAVKRTILKIPFWGKKFFYVLRIKFK